MTEFPGVRLKSLFHPEQTCQILPQVVRHDFCDDPASVGGWAGCLSVCVFVLQMPSRCVQLISDWEHLGPVL